MASSFDTMEQRVESQRCLRLVVPLVEDVPVRRNNGGGKYIFILCLLSVLFGGLYSGFARASGIRGDNEIIASAYKLAIDNFVERLRLRRGSELSNGGDFMAHIESYRSEVAVEKDGFCISFSPKEHNGGVVLGGTINYCFDKMGVVLTRITEER